MMKYNIDRHSYNHNKKNNYTDDSGFQLNEKFEEVLLNINIQTIFGQFDKDILEILDDIMKSHYITEANSDLLKEKLKILTEEKDLFLSTNKINRLYLDYTFDMSNNISKYYNDIFSEITNYKENIVRSMKAYSFFKVIDILKFESPSDTDISNLEDECINHYINWLVTVNGEINYHRSIDIQESIDYLKIRNQSYYDRFEELKESIKPQLNCELIYNTIQKIETNSAWGNSEEYILNALSVNEITNCLKESSKYMEEIVYFLKRNKHNSHFDDFIKTSIKAIKTIYDDSNDEIKIKIKTIFSYKNDTELLNQILIDEMNIESE